MVLILTGAVGRSEVRKTRKTIDLMYNANILGKLAVGGAVEKMLHLCYN